MDFYLTNRVSGVRLRFPLLPDRLNVKTGALSVALNIIKTGEIKIPRGTSLTGYSWSSMLPGESMRDTSFVFDWQHPQRIIDLLRYWEENGDTLRFMVTELSLNTDVFIESFSYEYYGLDSVKYTINLATRRNVVISTVPYQPIVNSDSGNKTTGTVTLKNESSYLNVRQKASSSSKSIGKLKHGERVEILRKSGNWYVIPYSDGIDGKAYVYVSYVTVDQHTSSASNGAKTAFEEPANSAKSSTYSVKNGDSLYSIAKRSLGSGSRYMEIYNLNRKAIDAKNYGKTISKYTIYEGQVLKLPIK